MSRLFDNYIMVGWSAASKPNIGNDSIWIGVLVRDVRRQLRFESFNPPTRQKAIEQIKELLQNFAKRGNKTLLGFDFALGYPHGTAAALKLSGTPWEVIHSYFAKEIKDKADNSNNRFSFAAMMNRIISDGPFPFWGCPARDTLKTLQPKKTIQHSNENLPEFRNVEVTFKINNPVWRLYSPGSVGSQCLIGIPYINKLRKELANVKLWPFETGWKPLKKDDIEDIDVVICEIYPSILKTKPAAGEAKDLAQVRAIAEHFAKLDDNEKLGEIFAPPKGTKEDLIPIIENEEGWILG